MTTLSDFGQQGWSAEPHGARKKRHFIKEGRHACNGTKAKSAISDTILNLPGGCIACKIVLGIASPYNKQRGLA